MMMNRRQFVWAAAAGSAMFARVTDVLAAPCARVAACGTKDRVGEVACALVGVLVASDGRSTRGCSSRRTC